MTINTNSCILYSRAKGTADTESAAKIETIYHVSSPEAVCNSQEDDSNRSPTLEGIAEQQSATGRERHETPPNKSTEGEKAMSTNDMQKKAAELKELKNMQQELADAITSVEDEIKAELTERGCDELTAGAFKISWKPVKSSRLDQKAIKAELPDIYARYTVQSDTRRFTVA